MKRITLAQVNNRLAPHGYELVRGNGYFYFWPLDDSHKLLYAEAVMTPILSAYSVEEWEQELLRKIDETY